MDALAAGDAEKAVILLRNCIEINPGHISGRYNLGIALGLLEEYDEARYQLISVLEQEPDYPGAYTALGQINFASFKIYLEQAEMYKEMMLRMLGYAIETDPEDVDAYFTLGNAYATMGDAERALYYLKQALRIDPNSAAIYFVLAKVFMMLKKYKRAKSMAIKAAALSSPKDPFIEDLHDLLAELKQFEAVH
jgi:tetratricopeptide (TPR) repeat protein